jgi:hypothetical protein
VVEVPAAETGDGARVVGDVQQLDRVQPTEALDVAAHAARPVRLLVEAVRVDDQRPGLALPAGAEVELVALGEDAIAGLATEVVGHVSPHARLAVRMARS